jgi:hypothetical protein
MTGSTLDSRGLEEINKIPLMGYINGIAIGPRARFCVVASGQEPRLGRWNRVAKAKNRFGIVRLRSQEDGLESDYGDFESGEDMEDSGFESDSSSKS